MASKKPARPCAYPKCKNMVAHDKWQKQGRKCHIHVNMSLPTQGSQDGQSSNPFVDPSVIFPDLLESSYSSLFAVKDRSHSASINNSRARSLSNIKAMSGRPLDYQNAKCILDTFNRFSNGQDLRIPSIAQKRYHEGALVYAKMIKMSPYLKNGSDVKLLRFKGMTLRPRTDGKKYVNENSEEINLFKEQHFSNRSHHAVLVSFPVGEMGDRKSQFIVDPLISALAPVGDGKYSRIPVSDNASLNTTPFGEAPWVANPNEYMDLNINGSIGWDKVVETNERI